MGGRDTAGESTRHVQLHFRRTLPGRMARTSSPASPLRQSAESSAAESPWIGRLGRSGLITFRIQLTTCSLWVTEPRFPRNLRWIYVFNSESVLLSSPSIIDRQGSDGRLTGDAKDADIASLAEKLIDAVLSIGSN